MTRLRQGVGGQALAWRDIDILARTLWGEARGEPELGRVAVAHVVLNRARIAAAGRRRKLFGDGTVGGACLVDAQFSCWNGGGGLMALDRGDDGYQEALYCALAAARGKVKDPTAGSTHYHADYVSPSWAAGRIPVCAIGRHKFYNDVD